MGRKEAWRRGGAVVVTALVGTAGLIASVAGGKPSADGAKIGDGTGGVRKQRVGTFDAPIFVTTAPGVKRKIYVVERAGKVRVLTSPGDVRDHPFINIVGRVDTAGERGLLSIAFHPRYQRNGRVYAYYTNNQGNIEIDEFKARSNNDAREGSRRKVLEIPHPGASNHNGGTIMFGPNDYLFAATGDGGGTGKSGNAQDKTSLLGKVLRIDPRRHGSRPFKPARTNPFVGKPGRDAIFALGLRNPYRFSFDRKRLAIGDVGEGSWEEVDLETKRNANGANFGWPQFEGNHPPGGSPSGPGHYERPIFEYPHSLARCESAGGCAITGGVVVHRGPPSLRGRYLYADFYKGDIRSFVPRLDGARRDRALGVHVDQPAAFARAHGRLYVASLAGRLYRLVRR